MLGTRPKFVLAAGTLLWAGFMIYLLTHVEKFSHYGGSLRTGYVQWASQIFSGDHNATQIEQDTVSSYSNRISEAGTINIIMQSGEDDLGGLISAVNSILLNTKHPVHFYFILPEITIQHLSLWMKIPELLNVKYSIAKLPEDLVRYPHVAKVMFVDLFPALQGQVIYMDSDIIVQGDVAELYKTPLVPDSLAAFSDDCHSGSASKSISSRGENRYAGRLNLKHPLIVNLEINPITCTFSTGVFLTGDLDIWRREGISERVLALAQANEKDSNHSIIGPQGGTDLIEAGMLAVFYGRASPLDPMWHVRHLGLTPGSRYSPFYLSTAKLLHWSGHFKPWKPSRNSGSAYEQKIWDKYYLRDPTGVFRPIKSKSKGEI